MRRIAVPLLLLFASALGLYSDAGALTSPISGAVALPAGADLRLPFPAGARVRISSGYSGSGGSSLHTGTDGCCSANDHYALDMVYADEADGGFGMPLVAALDGTVVRSGWATAGWSNYGLRVILRHDLGDGHVYHTLYAHMNAIDPAVTEGATVSQGQVLGELGRSCMGALSCSSFSGAHVHFALHRDSTVGGSGTGGSYGGNAVVPEPMDGYEDLARGDVLTSGNTGTVECGDGFCNGDETTASCPSDCPSCASIPSAGRVVDDAEICFERGGTASYWRSESAGWDDELWWTHATDTTVDNYAVWSLSFDEAGDYVVEAYTDGAWAQSQQAEYLLRHAGGEDAVVVDQSAVDGWNELGTFAFAAGGDQWVRLNDNTGEPYSERKQIVFDALRLTRVGGGGGDGGVTPGTDGGTVAPGTDGGTVTPGTDGGTTPGGDGGTVTRPGGSGSASGGCSASEGGTLPWPALLVLLVGLRAAASRASSRRRASRRS